MRGTSLECTQCRDRRANPAAIVGTGYIAEFHVRGIQEADGVELVAVCDANPELASAFAAGCGVPAYDFIDSMLAEERVDVVHVLVPPDLHHSVAKTALNAGAHVFVEKPMIVSSDEAAELLANAATNGLTVGVNHSMLFEGAFRKLRDHVRGGDLGPVDHLTFNYFTELALIRLGPFGNWMLLTRQRAAGDWSPSNFRTCRHHRRPRRT